MPHPQTQQVRPAAGPRAQAPSAPEPSPSPEGKHVRTARHPGGSLVLLRRVAALAACSTVAAVTAAQLLALMTARNAGAWSLQLGGQDATSRLLWGGAVTVVTLALLTWLDAPTRASRTPEGGSDVLR